MIYKNYESLIANYNQMINLHFILLNLFSYLVVYQDNRIRNIIVLHMFQDSEFREENGIRTQIEIENI
jgi:hypothetical protein